jgi:hypothetical protein
MPVATVAASAPKPRRLRRFFGALFFCAGCAVAGFAIVMIYPLLKFLSVIEAVFRTIAMVLK